MNNYEFWNDMDKIYDAIVAYQEKTIEFNKRFITPWVNLGNVFDKQEGYEEIVARKNAIEIDPENAQNWYELACFYTRSGDFDNSIQAYLKAIDLGLETGELYKNLALAYAMTAQHKESIPVFQKALNLLENEEDKAVVWNHLGNVYRKLNNYELALQAFQHADQFESVRSRFVEEPTILENNEETIAANVSEIDETSASKSTDEPATITSSVPGSDENISEEVDSVSLDTSTASEQVEAQEGEEQDGAPVISDAKEIEPPNTKELELGAEDDETDDEIPVVLEVDYSEDFPSDFSEENITESVEDELIEEELNEGSVTGSEEHDMETVQEENGSVETVTEVIPTSDEVAGSAQAPQEVAKDKQTVNGDEPVTSSEENDKTSSAETASEEISNEKADVEDEPIAEINLPLEEEKESVPTNYEREEIDIDEAATKDESVDETVATLEEVEVSDSMTPGQEETEVAEESIAGFVATSEESEDGEGTSPDPAPVTLEDPQAEKTTPEAGKGTKKVDEASELTPESDTSSNLSAYDEYLKDNHNPIDRNRVKSQLDDSKGNVMAPSKVETADSEIASDTNTDLTFDMDTKNAHVWNELGNVYFNAGSFDDAIAAYTKAIELDEQFPWPYTNLALSYVQKDRLAEAISLYQRSIELFSNEKDKAVTWNRLGNVYRRQNDYENAIAAYQRADELDPDNSAITKQSRFSLLGSEIINQETAYSM